MRTFVTGATGLIGSWLVKELLYRGHDVTAFVRDADPRSELFRSGDYLKTTIVNGCLENFADLNRAINENEADTIFHLAAQPVVSAAYRSPHQTFESNIRGSYNLLESCRLQHTLVKRIVIASSDKAYGTQPELPYIETMPLLAGGPYDVSKACTDLIAQSYAKTYSLPVCIARCGNVYGGGDLNWSRIVPHTIRSCIEKTQPVLRSDGSYTRDYIYVKDVANAYILLAEQADRLGVIGEAFNVSAMRPLSVIQLVNNIQIQMGCESIGYDIQNTSKAEIRSQYLDSEKAQRELGWQSGYCLESGLQETIVWYRSFLQDMV